MDNILKFLTTPVSKLKRVNGKDIILISRIRYSKDLDDYIESMESLKRGLEGKGYNVVGGYIIPRNEANGINNVYRIREKVKDSDWLMVDPYDAMYDKKDRRDKTVLSRLKDYLFFNYNRNIEITLLSKKLTEIDEIKEAEEKDKINGAYIIRNEGNLPFIQYKEDIEPEIQKQFIEEFKAVLRKYIDSRLDIDEVKIEDQLEMSKEYLKDSKTISLDRYYRGTYNIEVSRSFDVSDYQKYYINMTNRYGCESLQEQINKIEDGKYVLVEDDSVYGNTIRNVKNMLRPEIEIERVYLLSSLYKGKIYDMVDFRDFVVGSGNSGLNVKLPNGKQALAPYLLPYVSVATKANILKDKEVEFSAEMWKMNKKYLGMIDKNLKLKNCNDGFIKLMKYVGFNKESLLSEICDWHVKQLIK